MASCGLRRRWHQCAVPLPGVESLVPEGIIHDDDDNNNTRTDPLSPSPSVSLRFTAAVFFSMLNACLTLGASAKHGDSHHSCARQNFCHRRLSDHEYALGNSLFSLTHLNTSSPAKCRQLLGAHLCESSCNHSTYGPYIRGSIDFNALSP